MAGHIISILGGKGGMGKSQLAANLSFAYASENKAKTLLVDFDSRSNGDQNLITGIRTKKTLKDLAEYPGNIDLKSIQPFITTHPSNVSFVSMPTETHAISSIDLEGVGKALKSIPKIFPITILDMGSELTPLALRGLEYTTLIFLVVTPDILAINQTKRILSELTGMMFPKEMIHIIFNQYVKGHPVTPAIVGQSLGRPVFAPVTRDEQTCIQALSAKKPAFLQARNSAFSQSMMEIVRKINGKNVLRTLEKIVKQTQISTSKIEGGGPDVDAKSTSAWNMLKSRIYKALVDEMDIKETNDNDPQSKIIMREQTKKVVVDLLNKEDVKGILDSRDSMNRFVKEILDEALGLGPLEDLLADKECSEIMVVGPSKIYYEHNGKIKRSVVTFTNDRQVLNVIERIVAPIGRRIDEKTPYVDARLADGSRVHAIIPPSSIDGCTITIRKFPENRLTYKDLINYGSCTQNMADFFRIAVESHRNIIVSGGTGSGKTTLINILGGFIQANERIITCEDSAELDLPQEHVVRLETRPPTLEGDGEIDIRCLVKQTLRMRPDRIVVGECRGGEALDMLQAMGTGHDGSLTTIHSNNPRECIGRLETLVQYAEAGLPQKAIREMISNAIHMIIQQSRLEDGSRKIVYVTEIGGMQGDVVTLQDIFLFNQKDVDKRGKIVGDFQATGFIPKFIEGLERKGYNVPRGLFSNAAQPKPDSGQGQGQAPGGQKPATAPPKKVPGNVTQFKRPNRPPNIVKKGIVKRPLPRKK